MCVHDITGVCSNGGGRPLIDIQRRVEAEEEEEEEEEEGRQGGGRQNSQSSCESAPWATPRNLGSGTEPQLGSV